MNVVFNWIVFCIFVVASTALTVYGLHLYVLLWLFRRRASEKRRSQKVIIEAFHEQRAPDTWPTVTSQIPIYNEADVAERVIQAVAAMDYPAGKHEIQVLDDSNDHTTVLIDNIVHRLRAGGIAIQVFRRPDRQGYKAGALAAGLAKAKGPFVAVFDADFAPPSDFLKMAVPLLDHSPRLACIQGRWDHLNRDESWMTRAQALGLDAHFGIEQGARAWNGLMMNFNGTAGMWRKAAIEDPNVGGWHGDTLTEDMDLSYRAQLAGWRLDYCVDMPCPAEVPNSVPALKSQQRRWATGSIQVARKLLPRIWRSPISWGAKLEATLHLTNHSVAVWMLVLALLARPMLLALTAGGFFPGWFVYVWLAIAFSAAAPSLVYTYARYTLAGHWSGLSPIPSMFFLGAGLCLSTGLAVFRGLFTQGGEFVRTPKSGSLGGHRRASSYRAITGHLWLLELLMGFYCLSAFVFYFSAYYRAFSIFLLIYAVGFFIIGWQSRPRRARVFRTIPAPASVPGDPHRTDPARPAWIGN